MSDNYTSKSGGIWDVRRRVRIPSLVHEADGAALSRELESLEGIKRVVPDVSHHKIGITYDASLMDYHTVCVTLEKQGFPPANGWMDRLKANWYQFTDSNSRENANLPPPACCNKAPKKR
jgi:hypothetical protein